MKSLIITGSVEDITNDIRSTKDPIRKTILKKMLEIKINQMRAQEEDPSLSDMSSDISPDDNSDKQTDKDNENDKTDKADKADKDDKDDVIDEKTKEKIDSAKKELKHILSQQKKGLADLDKMEKIKAYLQIIDTNQKEADKKIIIAGRGAREKQWEGGTIYDPKYAKYQKDDTMNNRMMERLNSEIDFRTDDDAKIKVIKPFDDDDKEDITDEYAHYKPPKESNIKTKRMINKKSSTMRSSKR